MKRTVFIALIFNALAASLFAQPNAERREERIQAFRVAVFTEVLNLTSKEAEAFWPVYNEYTANKEKLNDQFKPGKPLDNMSDAEVEDQIKRHFERQTKELDLEKELVARLRSILPVRKIAKIPVAERRFREAIFQKMKEMRKAKKMMRRGPGGAPDSEDDGN